MKIHWERFADEAGVKFSYLKSIIHGISEKTKAESDKLLKEYSVENNFNKVAINISKTISNQIKRLENL